MTTGTTLGEDSQAVGERAKQSAKPSFLCQVVFIALGLLMLAAADFKTYEIYSQPMPRPSMVGSLALICFESCFGTWLLIGVRSAAVASFLAFACVSAYQYFRYVSSDGTRVFNPSGPPS